MFSVGIFTTHIPYLAMLAFYAYFLIFGVSQASDGQIKVTEKSHSVQIHINNSLDQTPADTFTFYASLAESTKVDRTERSKVKQRWKHFGIDKIHPQDYSENALFGRPPPVLA